jgi:pSer/pThr/pTyr-binding forkhead associated (FHA) protein
MTDQPQQNYLDPTIGVEPQSEANYGQPGVARSNDPTALIMDQQSASPVLARLIFTSQGPRYGDIFRIEGKAVLIGRDAESDVCIQDNTTSRQHAKIRVEGSGEDTHFMLHDLATDNGTFVNGQKIVGPVELQHNDLIRVGYTELMFKKI